MKKYYRFSWLLLLIGLILVAVGYFHDGFQPLAGDMHSSKVYVLDNHREVQQYKVAPFKKIRVDLQDNADNVQIKSGSKYQVKVINGQKNHLIKTYVNNKQELVVQDQGRYFYYVSVGLKSPQIQITVPRDQVLQSVQGNLQDGQLSLTDLQTQRLVLRADNSRINLQQLQVLQADSDFHLSDSQLHMQNSNLKKAKLNVDDSHLQFNNSQLQLHGRLSDSVCRLKQVKLLGTSKIQMKDSKFRLAQMTLPLNYQFKLKDTSIRQKGRRLRHNPYAKQIQVQPCLVVRSDDSFISMY
ncbi:DUF4097 domain-containing protein [Bombilactobacillus folatiphilus]|uniref:DUF4097 domain-containing protein n=1 Tax=Bombilactobacillus folatiphilus TaxID=2923362 RepID=A0ABY4P890_9LACO|nr:DUF4097 family beta strand repeat-containing protein [Bombilactobacillus folatiphilus]UQS81744.1 DUF4097 domain-containing protein [Bombilactobacillus folatiphilus]